MSKSVKNIAILASGAGSNAQKILEHFSDRMDISVRLIVSNKQEAGVLNIAKVASIDTFVVTRDSFYSSTDLLVELNKRNIDFIVLAGFLWLIPPYLLLIFIPPCFPNMGVRECMVILSMKLCIWQRIIIPELPFIMWMKNMMRVLSFSRRDVRFCPPISLRILRKKCRFWSICIIQR